MTAPSAAHASGFAPDDPQRSKVAERLDEAIRQANRLQSGHFVLRTWSDVPSLVVRKDATLTDLRRAAPHAVRPIGNGRWLISRTIIVTNNATLKIGGPGVRELRLVSDDHLFTSLTTRDAHLKFRGRRGDNLIIRSWNPKIRGADHSLDNGRSSVVLRMRSRLDAFDTTFQDLGFYEGRVSGVALKAQHGTVGGTGTVYRSTFKRNMFGAYTYVARDMKWVANRFVDNAEYGFDPHDDSSGFIFVGNYAARNQRHGIIFSRMCSNNIIKNNLAEHNGWHGIVIDDGKNADGASNYNVIEGNTIRDNSKVGISIDGSHFNKITNNQISGHRYGVRVYGPSNGNVIAKNKITDSRDFGVFLDNPAKFGVVRDNDISGAETGVRIRESQGTKTYRNNLTSMRGHGVKIDGKRAARTQGTRVGSNLIEGEGASPIYIDVPDRDTVALIGGTESWDYPLTHDIARVVGWYLGPLFWLGLALMVLLGPLSTRIVERKRGRVEL